MANKKKRRRKWMAVIAFLLLAYVSSYFILSRRGFAQADNWNAKGFYFVFPSSPAEWKVNWCLVVVYYPLIVIDNMLGTGRPIGSEPIYRLSDGSPRVLAPLRRQSDFVVNGPYSELTERRIVESPNG